MPDFPNALQPVRRWDRVGLYGSFKNHDPARREELCRSDRDERRRSISSSLIGWVEKDQVELSRFRGPSPQILQNLHWDHLAPIEEAGDFEVPAERPKGRPGRFHEDSPGCATAQGLNPYGAGPGVQVEKRSTGDLLRQEIEQDLPEVIRGRPRLPATRGPKPSPSGNAPDHPHESHTAGASFSA